MYAHTGLFYGANVADFVPVPIKGFFGSFGGKS